ncbi:MAG: hypothetical protein GY754_14725, partial [bacterium]|nr:hypothetical protein [bacterium]
MVNMIRAIILLTIFLVPVIGSAAPVTIEETKYHVTILKDGKCEVLYQLTFTEHQGRDRIRTIGQFIEPMTFIETYGKFGAKRFKVRMESKGNAFYAAVFGLTTGIGKKYTVYFRYRIDKSVLDNTTYNNKPYSAFWWAPVQWSLPIKKQTVQIILPIEIPAKYRKAHQIKDALVNKHGVVVDTPIVKAHSRWVYYPSKWKGKNYLSIHAEKLNLSVQERESLKFYIPKNTLETGAQGGDYTLDKFTAKDMKQKGTYSIKTVEAAVKLQKAAYDPLTLREITEYRFLVVEEGERNIFRKLVDIPVQGAHVVPGHVDVLVNGKDRDARVRLAAVESGAAKRPVYDLILASPVTKNDVLQIKTTFERSLTMKIKSELFNSKFRAGYQYSGIQLSQPVAQIRVKLLFPFQGEYRRGFRDIKPGDKELPLFVTPETTGLFEQWEFVQRM